MKTARAIQQQVMAALNAEANLNMATIGVSVHNNNIVMLNGWVDSYSKKITAQQAVWHVPGGRALADQIDVILPWDEKLTDTVIAANILLTLGWLNATMACNIRLKVEQSAWFTNYEDEIDPPPGYKPHILSLKQ